jgi:hypothetical protein
MNPLDLLRTYVRGHITNREELTSIGLVRLLQFAPNYPAQEREDELILACLPVHTNEPFDGDLQAGFLSRLTNGSFVRKLTALNAAAGQVPDIHVPPVTQEHTSPSVKDHGMGSDGEQAHPSFEK